MKKNHIIFLCALFILLLGIIYNPITINADSGFDSSWDSGGSDWGDSSDFSSSSSGGFYIGIGNSSGFLIFVVSAIVLYFIYYIAVHKFNAKNIGKPIFIIFLVISFFTAGIGITMYIIFIMLGIKSNANRFKNMNYSTPPLTKQQILELDPNLNIEEFNQIVFNNYKDIQTAWMNFDLNTIQNLVSDEIYNMYSMQLDTLKVKGQKNMMEDIKYINNSITKITFENNIETINTILQVECYDYLINESNKVIRGTKNQKLIYTYELTFTKYTTDKKINYCPNCGAKININSSGKCEYCNSIIINKETKWIMTKKQMLNQRRK